MARTTDDTNITNTFMAQRPVMDVVSLEVFTKPARLTPMTDLPLALLDEVPPVSGPHVRVVLRRAISHSCGREISVMSMEANHSGMSRFGPAAIFCSRS
jgi:hypothetical protein